MIYVLLDVINPMSSPQLKEFQNKTEFLKSIKEKEINPLVIQKVIEGKELELIPDYKLK